MASVTAGPRAEPQALKPCRLCPRPPALASTQRKVPPPKVAALPGDPITSWGPFPSPCREPLHLPPPSPPHLSSASCKLKMASVPRRAGPALVCPGESHAPGLMAGSPQDQLSPCKRRRIGPHSVPGRPRPGRWAQMTGRPPWAPLSLTGGPGLLTSLQTGQGGLGSVCLPLCQQSQASVPRPSTADTRQAAVRGRGTCKAQVSSPEEISRCSFGPQ